MIESRQLKGVKWRAIPFARHNGIQIASPEST
jgi:hypothetical protein